MVVEALFLSGPWPYTSRGTDWSWLDGHGLVTNCDYEGADLSDPDNDHALNWEEYVAGTDPTNAGSVFVVLGVEVGAESNCVTWYGWSGGWHSSLVMDRITNMTDSNGWVRITNNVGPMVPVGTHTWWDIDPPDGDVFYRPVITNSW